MRVALKRVPVALLACLLLVVVIGAVVLACRHEQERQGAGAVASPDAPTAAFADGVPAQGRFEASVSYTLFGAESAGEITSSVLWDDAWFSAEPTAYNHDLARAAMLLSTLAYSESGYYQAGSSQPAYMEDALATLGFSRVSTESYRYRSEVVDEVLDAVTQQADGVAYTIASKQVEDATEGSARELIAVSVRGSYGSEWLSNFNLGDAANELVAQKADGHHSGYLTAAEEIKGELDAWREAAHSKGHAVSVLLCGHSRGGAVAGLLASMLDDEAAESVAASEHGDDAAEAALAAADRVFAYTFASPRTTVAAAGDAARYGNIFNIVNPADPVPYLPLESWGFNRNGVTVGFPGQDRDGFDAAHRRMLAAFSELTGEGDAYDPDAEQSVRGFVEDASERVPSARELMTPGGAVGVTVAAAAHLNPLTILRGHYPSVYLAWLNATDAADLALPDTATV
ncbi:MAG: hypothetical protein E7001_05625 [Coriobacteriaceae bacterium]|nr:hypothetical protein [Coriobacteriaceae bacterium]